MKTRVCLLIVMLLLGISAQVTAKSASEAMIAKMKSMDHSHIPIEIPADTPIPALSLSLSKDVMTGYNLKILTAHYIISPPPVDAQDMDALMVNHFDKSTGYLEGHAHLYINGIKIQRLYGQNVHIPGSLLKKGTNSISVTLNNHGHMYWTVIQRKIVATIYIDTQSPELIKYQFEGFPVNADLIK